MRQALWLIVPVREQLPHRVRCIDQHEAEAGAWGESHFLREGVWIATGWVNAGPNGYTHDMVTTIFG